MDATPTSHVELLRMFTSTKSTRKYLFRALAGILLAGGGARLTSAYLHGHADVPLAELLTEMAIAVALTSIALTIASALPMRKMFIQVAEAVGAHEKSLLAANASQAFLRRIHVAFEMADYEDELYESAGQVLAEATPGSAEVLVADASQAHVASVATATARPSPGCGVTSPQRCPAVRRGTTLTFENAKHFSACPRLREREFDGETVACCVPVNILGSASAVVHSVIPREEFATNELPHIAARLEGVAERFGDRLGAIRAIAKTQLQANTDPLTGLLNRRALENKVRELRHEGVTFAVAMVDLDHFKKLNDAHGHDTGDRALRSFARAAQTALRGEDLVCRHGGEEFVFVLPGANATSAEAPLFRVRDELRNTLAAANLPMFTASIGVADSTWSDDWNMVLQHADRALLAAKAAGRDRILIADQNSSAMIPTDVPANVATDVSDAPVGAAEIIVPDMAIDVDAVEELEIVGGVRGS